MKRIQNERWLDALPEEVVNVAEEINIEIAKVIAERIKAIGELTPSDVKKLTNSLQFLGADLKKITKVISEYSERGQRATTNALKQAADASDEFAEVLYAARKMSARSWQNDLYLHKLVDAMAKQTGAQFSNLSQTLAYKINNQTISLRRMYTRAIDKAIYEVQSGTVDYHTAMRKTVKELSSNMRFVHWESGHTRRLDSHVRQNLIDGVKQLQTQILDYHGDQFKSDGVELSAHAICAPDHLAVQGRQFSNDEFDKMQNGLDFEDVNGNEYQGFPRPIGQWNCRHVKFPIIIGISKPAHTDEELKAYAENSREKYSLTQQQRAMETKLRQLKTERLAASTAGDELEAKRIQKKINEQQAEYRQFSAKNNLLYDTRRASVEGYRRISIKGLQNLENCDTLKKKIGNGELSLTINPEKQNPHMLEHLKDGSNKSYFTIPFDELQDLLNANYATGRVFISRSGQIKEVLFVNRNIGYDVDEAGLAVETNGFKVHYSKGRTHLVPYRRRLEDETI
ncbi:MAG: hypothetical protein IJ370_08165 [Oscillospiraceae bacterium]|nr:hypothetical protein [Oscillospiraceae bacterium]